MDFLNHSFSSHMSVPEATPTQRHRLKDFSRNAHLVFGDQKIVVFSKTCFNFIVIFILLLKLFNLRVLWENKQTHDCYSDSIKAAHLVDYLARRLRSFVACFASLRAEIIPHCRSFAFINDFLFNKTPSLLLWMFPPSSHQLTLNR